MQRKIDETILKDIKQLFSFFSCVFLILSLFLLHIIYIIYIFIIYIYIQLYNHKYPISALCFFDSCSSFVLRGSVVWDSVVQGDVWHDPARCVGSGLHLGGCTAGTGGHLEVLNCLPLKIIPGPKRERIVFQPSIFQGLMFKLSGGKTNHPCVKRNHLPSFLSFSGWRFVNLLGCI